MPQQLIYTSAPRGLVAGRSGYCTVARSATMREALMLRLEQLSYFRHLSLSGNREHAIYAYRIVDIRGTRFHVLSRIQDAGLDFSGRTNFIAHHLAFSPEETSQLASPAVILGRWTGWQSGWAREPQSLDNEDWSGLAALSKESSLPAKNWAQATGDAVNGYGLLDAKPGACFRVDDACEDRILSLLAESCELADVRERRGGRVAVWQYTFTTSLQEQDNPADFRWRMVHANNPAFARLAGAGCAPLLSIRAVAGTEEERAFACHGPKAPGSVTIEPKRCSVTEGSVARFEVKSDGIPQPAFQWYEVEHGNAIRLEGQTGSMLEVPAAGRSRRYMVRATNSVGQLSSPVAELSIIPLVGQRQRPTRDSGEGEAKDVVPRHRKSEKEIELQRNRMLADQAEKTWRRKQSTRQLLIISISTLVLVGALIAWFALKNKGSTPAPGATNDANSSTLAATNLQSGGPTTDSAGAVDFATNKEIINVETGKVAVSSAVATNAATEPAKRRLLGAPNLSVSSDIPAPWKAGPIGELTAGIKCLTTSDGYVLTGAGTSLTSGNDSFLFVRRSVIEDGEFSGTLVGLSKEARGDSRCGIMMRESTNANAAFVFVGASPQNSFWTTREESGRTGKETVELGFPNAVKLKRSGSVFEGYCQMKNGDWKQIGSVKMRMSTNYLVGLVVCSGNPEQPLTGSLRNVEWRPAP